MTSSSAALARSSGFEDFAAVELEPLRRAVQEASAPAGGALLALWGLLAAGVLAFVIGAALALGR